MYNRQPNLFTEASVKTEIKSNKDRDIKKVYITLTVFKGQ